MPIIRLDLKNISIIFTIFNPLAMASYLADDETRLVHLRRYPDKIENALKTLTETVRVSSKGR